jgi:hypothetical protein
MGNLATLQQKRWSLALARQPRAAQRTLYRLQCIRWRFDAISAATDATRLTTNTLYLETWFAF